MNRDLDIEAAKLMGWTCRIVDGLTMAYGLFSPSGGCYAVQYRCESAAWGGGVPHFSSDPTACAELKTHVLKVREDVSTVESQVRRNHCRCTITTPMGAIVAAAMAPTECEAVTRACVAALKEER